MIHPSAQVPWKKQTKQRLNLRLLFSYQCLCLFVCMSVCSMLKEALPHIQQNNLPSRIWRFLFLRLVVFPNTDFDFIFYRQLSLRFLSSSLHPYNTKSSLLCFIVMLPWFCHICVCIRNSTGHTWMLQFAGGRPVKLWRGRPPRISRIHYISHHTQHLFRSFMHTSFLWYYIHLWLHQRNDTHVFVVKVFLKNYTWKEIFSLYQYTSKQTLR